MEGPDNHLLIISDPNNSECSGYIRDVYIPALSEGDDQVFKTIHAPKNASYVPDSQSLGNWVIDLEGVTHVARKLLTIGGGMGMNDPDQVKIIRANSGTWPLSTDSRLKRLTDYDRRLVMFHGDGTQGQPTGAITITVDSGGSLNGVTDGTLVFSGFYGPLLLSVFELSLDVWRVDVISGWRPTGTATWDPPSLISGANANTTVTVTGAALGDTVLSSFSLDLQGMRMTSYVSAANTVAIALTNITGGTIDLASGTVTAKVIR